MHIKATIVAYAFSVQCFENATIVAYAGLRVNYVHDSVQLLVKMHNFTIQYKCTIQRICKFAVYRVMNGYLFSKVFHELMCK